MSLYSSKGQADRPGKFRRPFTYIVHIKKYLQNIKLKIVAILQVVRIV